MKTNILKYLIIFSSFFVSIIISIYTFFSYVPKDNIPDVFPIQKIIVDPSPKNSAAIKCYEKVGFKKVEELLL